MPTVSRQAGRVLAGITGLMIVLGASFPARASDPVGVYALVEKVVLEPNEQAPERIQIWGVFALAQGQHGNEYQPPVRGYLYFAIPPGQAQLARNEWADLKKMAGTGQIAGFGSRRDLSVRVRRAGEKAASPDLYPIHAGLFMMRRYSFQAGVQSYQSQLLRSLPAPLSPADGAEVIAGKITLVIQNMPDQGHRPAKYVFEIAGDSGSKEVSPAVAAGERETRWSPALKAKAGEKYTWRVWAVDGNWTGPAASASFTVKAAR
jgi:hypothetical protein